MAGLLGLLPSMPADLDFSPSGPEGSKGFVPRLHRTEQHRHSMPGDGAGFTRGLMLLDYDHDDIARGQNWRDPEANINAVCQVMVDCQRQLRRRALFQRPGLLRASIAAFNCCILNLWQAIRQGLDVDHPSRGWNFGRDVLNRARFFQVRSWD